MLAEDQEVTAPRRTADDQHHRRQEEHEVAGRRDAAHDRREVWRTGGCGTCTRSKNASRSAPYLLDLLLLPSRTPSRCTPAMFW